MQNPAVAISRPMTPNTVRPSKSDPADERHCRLVGYCLRKKGLPYPQMMLCSEDNHPKLLQRGAVTFVLRMQSSLCIPFANRCMKAHNNAKTDITSVRYVKK